MRYIFQQPSERPFIEQDGGAAIGYSIYAEPPRVLHIDADPAAALLLSMLLVPETQVIHVNSLLAAEAMLRFQQFALVVLDPDLPDGDGASLVALVQRRQQAGRLLLYSARPYDDGVDGTNYLPKPATAPRQLWRAVSDLLEIGAMPLEPQ